MYGSIATNADRFEIQEQTIRVGPEETLMLLVFNDPDMLDDVDTHRCGKPPTIIRMFQNHEYAVLEPDGRGFRSAGPGAWRWLGWQIKDPEIGRIEVSPPRPSAPSPAWTRRMLVSPGRAGTPGEPHH